MKTKGTIHTDFETYSECDLKKCGAHVYAEDDTTEVLCLAYAFNDKEPKQWVPEMELPEDLFEAIASGEWTFAAHNANFELLIWEKVCVDKMFWPALPADLYVLDTAAVAAMKSLPRALDTLGTVLNLKQQKDKRGNILIRKLCKPRKPTKKNSDTRLTPLTAPEDFKALYEYNKQDVRTERDVHKKLGELPPREYRLWQLDRKINGRGIHVNLKALKGAIKIMRVTNHELNEEASKISGGAFVSLNQREAVMAWATSRGYPLNDYTADYLDEVVKDIKIPEDVLRVLEIRRMTSRTSTKKYLAMARALCKDKTLKGTLLYHGAGTGRWAGKIIQPQNLPRPTIKEDDITIALQLMEESNHELLSLLFNGDPSDTMVSCIRGTLIPDEGNVFVCGDFSNVEGRGLVWSANDQAGLDMYASKIDTYIDMATEIYGIEYDDVDNDQRRMGKLAILGLGYGMGAPKFVATALSRGVVITLEFAKRVVDAYRRKYKAVVQYWKDLETAAINAIRHPGKKFNVRDVVYQTEGDFLTCKLASGRKLYYPFPEVRLMKAPWGDMKDTVTYMVSEKNHWKRTKTFGGKLAENIVQATARDLLVDAMFNVEDKEYPIILTVHDEILSEIHKKLLENGNKSLQEFSDLMKQLPTWAKGFPVDVDCWQGERYRK